MEIQHNIRILIHEKVKIMFIKEFERAKNNYAHYGSD